jgi:peptidoglycan hydrolase CwlO-like protein
MDILGTISVVASVASICGVICALVVATRNKKKDDVSDGQNIGILHTDVGYIKKGIEGIERHLEKIDEQYIDVIMQLTEVKGEVKRHTKRIEKLESYHDPKGDKTNG